MYSTFLISQSHNSAMSLCRTFSSLRCKRMDIKCTVLSPNFSVKIGRFLLKLSIILDSISASMKESSISTDTNLSKSSPLSSLDREVRLDCRTNDPKLLTFRHSAFCFLYASWRPCLTFLTAKPFSMDWIAWRILFDVLNSAALVTKMSSSSDSLSEVSISWGRSNFMPAASRMI